MKLLVCRGVYRVTDLEKNPVRISKMKLQFLASQILHWEVHSNQTVDAQIVTEFTNFSTNTWSKAPVRRVRGLGEVLSHNKTWDSLCARPARDFWAVHCITPAFSCTTSGTTDSVTRSEQQTLKCRASRERILFHRGLAVTFTLGLPQLRSVTEVAALGCPSLIQRGRTATLNERMTGLSLRVC